MGSKKFMLCASVCMLVSAISVTGQAADANKDKAPIIIEADNLSFSDLTGDIFADGHVSFKKNTETLLTDSMRGNTKQTEVWIDGKATLQQPGTELIGTGTHYNYTSRVGDMQKAKGKVNKDFVSAVNMDFSPSLLVAHDGTVTECPAIVPDYHVSAEKIEIWPGDKMIAYNAKFWIKNVVIFTLPKYQTSLKKGAAGVAEAFPRVGYTSDDGISIKQNFQYPISDHVVAFADLWYYSKSGFKPQYGVVDSEKNYSVKLIAGDYKDGNDHWITKEPELKFDFYSHRLGNLPVSYTVSAAYGKWSDPTKSSWHQDYSVYFTHDTINLSKSLSLNLGAGLQRVQESYDNSVINSFRFDTVVTKQWSPKFATTTEYHYTKNNNALFDYNTADLGQEADVGFTYKINQKNAVGVRTSYDLNNSKIYDQDYTWYKDLHCWQAAITYRAKREQLKVDLTTTRW